MKVTCLPDYLHHSLDLLKLQNRQIRFLNKALDPTKQIIMRSTNQTIMR